MTDSNSTQHDSAQLRTSGNTRNVVFYFLAGGGIGAALALLFAPKSGAELRTDISDVTRKGYDETVHLAHQVKEQSAEVYQALKDKKEEVYDFTVAKLSVISDATAGLSDLPGAIVDGTGQLIKGIPSQKKAARRSASIL